MGGPAEPGEEMRGLRGAWDDVMRLAFSGGTPRPGLEPGLTLGSFRIVRELGRGGMGTVYLADDLRDGGQVALKSLHPHLLERRDFLARFQREAQAGKRVRHENVVRTFDATVEVVGGVTLGLLVMEHVNGRTVRTMLREWGMVPEALVREIARQVAEGLDAIHTAGIVHRDLKPENLLVTEDHHVRIMDLGVARLTEVETSLTKEGQFAGTLAYAAPEQFEDSAVSPAADLYALGVVLYELTTGVNPFDLDDPRAVMYAHLETVPEALQVRRPDASAFLEEVIGTLLTKRPEERFSSARELAGVLEHGEDSSWWAERDRARRTGHVGIPRVPIRREASICGRDGELARLRGIWEQADAGKGSIVLLEGEAGIGKSRLVDAFLRGLDGTNARVLYGSYAPTGGMGGIVDAVLQHFGRAGLDAGLARLLTDQPRLVTAVAALIRRDAPPPGTAALSDDAVQAAFVQLARAWASETSLVWVVEDIHFADADSRRVLLALSRACAEHPILLLLTSRPREPDRELALLGQQADFYRVSLPRLGTVDVTRILQETLRNPDLAARIADLVARRSDGVPLFVFELLRTMREDGCLTERADGSWDEANPIEALEVPSVVQDLIEVRLRSLSRGERALLDAACVAGFTIDADLLARACDMRRIQVLQHLAAVERRSGAVRSEGMAFRFDHHQLQEALYAGLPESLRREHHTLLADAYAEREGLETTDPEGLAGEAAVFLATHRIRGHRPKEGRPFLEPAMAHLGTSHRREAAMTLARRALDQKGLLSGELRAQTLLRLANHLKPLGRAQEARSLIEEARDAAESAGDRSLMARVAHTHGLNLLATSELDPAARRFEDALALGEEIGDHGIQARAHIGFGHTCLLRSRFDEARTHYEQARDLARAGGDRVEEASAAGALGAAAWYIGTPEEALVLYEEELELSRAANYPRGTASALSNLGMILERLGRPDEARERYEESLRLNRELGRVEGEAACLKGLGHLLGIQGRHEEAAAFCARAIDVAVRTGDRDEESHGRATLGHHLGMLGRVREARESLGHAIDTAVGLGTPYAEGEARLLLARLAEQQGKTEEALHLAQRALELLKKTEDSPSEPRVLRLLGRLERRRGNQDAALRWLDEAMANAEASGERLNYLLAAAERAVLDGAGVDRAAALLEEYGDAFPHSPRLEVRYLLWRATGDPEHLREAHRLLMHSHEHTSESLRESLLQNVPIHREIWDACGGG